LFSPYSKSCFILLKILIYLKKKLVGEFCFVDGAWQTGYSALADAVAVALSTAVTDVFCRSQ
jgi:hypothetical protein